MVRDLATDQSKSVDRLIRGCQVFIPETLFVKEGKFDFILQLDRDFCMNIDPKTKLTNLNVKIKLGDVVKEKKKDFMQYGFYKQL